MRIRLIVWLALAALIAGPAVSSAQQTGEIFGKVTDASGGVLPGVTVTLTSPVLIVPQSAVTSETGSYRFPLLPVGLYTVKFDLTGFKTVVREGIRIEIGFNAQINSTMEISQVQETITVTGESPVVDTRDTGKTTRFNQEALQAIPSARDPWVIIEQTPGVAIDRQNVGGSLSGQQSNFVARGAAFREQKWNLDGVDITDMSATGGSPNYFDFDAFEEMQISTGGADVSMQSPGVAINMVTKSGTDKLRGSGRFYVTDDSMQSINITDALRKQGATSGAPVQNIRDYGIEAGGPIKRGKAWFWGSYGKQDIKVGVNGFFKPDPTCQAMKANPLGYSVPDIWSCLNTDLTVLNNYNAKFSMELFHNNQFSMYYNGAEKVRNARGADDLHPVETTSRQIGVSPDLGLGSRWWKTGMPKNYKWTDREIFTDRFMMEYSYAHVGNNFVLDFHEDALADVQPTYEISTGMNGRSSSRSVYVRPTDSIDITGNYFWPGFLGGDHSFRFGFKYRNDVAHTEQHYGGNAQARLSLGVPAEVTLYRDGRTEYELHNRNLYVQDSFSRGRLVLNLGLRYDYQTDQATAQTVPASPFYGQATFAGVYNNVTYTGQPFNQLPAMQFKGAKALLDKGLAYKNFSPRLGLTYDFTGNGRNVAKFSFARYVSQNGSGTLSSTYQTGGQINVRYPWVDLNGDTFVQAKEIVMTAAPLSWSSNYNYRDPTNPISSGRNDPDLEAGTTNELMVSFDREIGADFAVGASYIWRKYEKFAWSDTPNWTSANYVAVNYPPTGCPSGARCETITYYQPTSQIPVGYVYTMQPDYWRGYQGFELTARKRMSKSWMLNGGFSYNDAPVHYDSPAAYEDPTNIEQRNGGQYAQESTSSGISNVFVNAKWLFRLSGAYTLPWWQIGVAAFYNARGGYPYQVTIQTPNRPFSAGRADVLLDRWGDVRLPNFQTVDFRLDKPFTFFGRVRILGSMDVFNLFNGSTSLSIRGRQNASNANQISSIVGPRVVRFGFRATW